MIFLLIISTNKGKLFFLFFIVIAVEIIVLIDLDLTFFVVEHERGAVNQSHHIHSDPILLPIGDLMHSVFLINPDKMAKMIKQIYDIDKSSGVPVKIIFFTSGLWPKDVASRVADELFSKSTDKDVIEKFKTSTCISPQTDLDRFYSNITDEKKIYTKLNEIRNQDKGERLEKWKLVHGWDERCHFILLDDNESHLDSCENIQNVHTIKATTDEESRDFYKAVVDRVKSISSDNKKCKPQEDNKKRKRQEESSLFHKVPRHKMEEPSPHSAARRPKICSTFDPRLSACPPRFVKLYCEEVLDEYDEYDEKPSNK